MKRIALALALLLAPLLAPQAALAQATTAKVVSACSSQAYTPGSKQYPTMSTNGDVCTSGTGGGGGGGTASFTAIAAGNLPVVAGANKPAAIDLFSSLSVIPKDASGNYTALATSANQSALTGSKAGGTAATSSELVGGVYNTSLPSLTNGQQASLQFDSSGRLITSAAGGIAQGATTSGQLGGLNMGSVTTAAPTYTTGQVSPLSLDTAGNLRVNIVTGAASGTVAQGSTTSGQSGMLIQGAVTTAAPTYTTAQTSPLSLTTAGEVRTSVTSSTPIANLTGTKAAGTAATNSLLSGSVFVTNGTTTLTTGQQVATQVDSKGSAKVSLFDSSGAYLDPTLASAVQCGTTTGTMVQCALDNTNGSTGSTAPTRAQLMGAQSGANMVSVIQASASAAISVSTATTTQIVALASSQKIYVTALDVIAAGTGNITFVYGTGSNCGTGTTSLTGAYNLTAQAGIAKGSGLGPVLVVPASNALCVTTSAAVQMSGSVAYTQF